MSAVTGLDVLRQALAWKRRGRPVALATLVADGDDIALMIVDSDGTTDGTIRPGPVDSAIAHEAAATLADGEPRLLTFGTGAAAVRVFVEPVERIDLIEREVSARESGAPLAHVLDLNTGLSTLVFGESVVHGRFGLSPELLAEAEKCLERKSARLIDEGEDGRRLLIRGGLA